MFSYVVISFRSDGTVGGRILMSHLESFGTIVRPANNWIVTGHSDVFT